MSLRRPTLAEWFNAHQHRTLWRENSLVFGTLDVDVTAITADWEARELQAHYPSILARAAALAAVEVPELNRVYLRTLWGDRWVEFDGVHVAMPVRFEHDGMPILDATVLKNAHERSALELRDALRAYVSAGLEATTLTRWIATHPNHPWWRWALRLVHALSWRWPLFAEHGGAISVSAIAPGNVASRRLNYAGPTPISVLVALTGIERTDGRTVLTLGITLNHLVADGRSMGQYLRALAALLEGEQGVEALR